MSLILAGIDEAGYGPLLGPLCVGLSVFEVSNASAGQGVPCLWKVLEAGVCRTPGRGGRPDASGRIAVADSKLLKLASGVKTTHPLVHLERGVLAFARCAHEEPRVLPSDAELMRFLSARAPAHEWYLGPPITLPLAHDASTLAIASNLLATALRAARVRVAHMGCRVMGEGEFNAIAHDEGGKGATTIRALSEHLAMLWNKYATVSEDGATRLGVACDRLGGRTEYAGVLQRIVPGASVRTVEETPLRSRYVIEGVGASGEPRRMGVAFLVGGESGHLPVALSSMIAKYVRELWMMRFNRTWIAHAQQHGVELKPTAGYALDAKRWLRDTRSLLDERTRGALIRVV